MSVGLEEALAKVKERAKNAYLNHIEALQALYEERRKDIIRRLSNIKNSV